MTRSGETAVSAARSMRRLRRITRALDWRILFGFAVTAAYLGFGGYQLFDSGWQRLLDEPLDALGNFLEGAFAPLAFLWLVIGYFLQHRALKENNLHIALQYRQMRRSTRHLEVQAKALVSNEVHVRQETYLKLATLVNGQLGAIAGLIYLANARPLDHDGSAAAEVQRMWARVANGDTGVFSRRLIDMCHSPTGRREEGWRLFFGTATRRKHTEAFISTFRELLDDARVSGVKQLIVDAMLGGTAHGYLYRTVNDYLNERELEEPAKLKSGQPGVRLMRCRALRPAGR